MDSGLCKYRGERTGKQYSQRNHSKTKLDRKLIIIKLYLKNFIQNIILH